jgi:hypothetical protein
LHERTEKKPKPTSGSTLARTSRAIQRGARLHPCRDIRWRPGSASRSTGSGMLFPHL